MYTLLYYVLGLLLGFCLFFLIVYSEFPALVRYVIASPPPTIPSSSRNEQLLDLLFFHVLNPAMATDKLIDHVQRKLDEKDARLTTKCFTSMKSCLTWERNSDEGRIPVPLTDLELELNDMPEKHQEDYDIFVKTFYERLEIDRQGGEFATKESYKKLGSLKFIWTREERRLRLKDDEENIREGACDAADRTEKGISDPDR
ncbi:hypothetical protein BPAE_0091g00160 [Botrytis paeoniae]|uniref:Uncharacterized protein n=1 Tax=Botrytis paeoniae TaxID=278948 RepID=A0A4Z1FPK2_9HELO|nr:hypothetical protein BPAE_0091g00160 [Botrytis paeoniae]